MNKPNGINISFSSNDGYAEHLTVAIYSLLKNLGEEYFANIYILDGGISEQHKDYIKNMVSNIGNGKIEFIKMNRKKYEGWNTKGLSQETYYRLDLPELVPGISKILYLDVDLIVNGDIGTFFELDLGKNIIGAVREITTINYYKDDHDIKSPHKLFFNAGVLLINLDLMRSENIKEKIILCMEKYNYQLKTHDQEALNIVLLNDWKSLPPKYNALPFLWSTKTGKYLGYTNEEFREAKDNPVIIHFAGEKPWNQNCFHPLANIYHKYRKECGLHPIKYKNKITFKALLKQTLSKITLFLQANIPNKIYRYLIYKPYRFLFRIK